MNDLPQEKHFRLGNELMRRIKKHTGGYTPLYMIHQSKTIQEADPNQAKKNLQIISSKLKVSKIIKSRKTFINILILEGVDYVRTT